jgi:hypothetical protein
MLKVFAGLLSLGVGAILLIYGAGEDGVREVIRWTARTSLCLLCLAMAAYGIRGRDWSHWAGILRSLALSHTVHAGAVGTLAVFTGGNNLLERSAPVDVLGGALAYAFIFWGALEPGSRLVPTGLFWIWSVFLVSYGTRAIEKPIPFAFAVALLAAAMLVRLWGGQASRALHRRSFESQHRLPHGAE